MPHSQAKHANSIGVQCCIKVGRNIQSFGYGRILFVEPGATSNIFHNNVLNDALNIDAAIFCKDVLAGAAAWLQIMQNSDNYRKNFPLFMQRYPAGLPPYIVGIPVIG